MKKFESIFGIKPLQAKELLGKLTPRQLQVAEQMALGRANKLIAEEFGISRKTLDVHRATICSKLDTSAQGIPRIVFAAKFAVD